MSKSSIPSGTKDAEGIFTKVTAKPQESTASKPLAPEPVTHADMDITTLLGKTTNILVREIRNLMAESLTGKLSPNSSRDLVNYVKLLKELYDAEKDILEDLSSDELKEILKKRNDKAKLDSDNEGA